jgi:hypothetical protein
VDESAAAVGDSERRAWISAQARREYAEACRTFELIVASVLYDNVGVACVVNELRDRMVRLVRGLAESSSAATIHLCPTCSLVPQLTQLTRLFYIQVRKMAELECSEADASRAERRASMDAAARDAFKRLFVRSRLVQTFGSAKETGDGPRLTQ